MSMLVPGIVMYVAAMVGAAGWWLVRGLRERETGQGEARGHGAGSDTVR